MENKPIRVLQMIASFTRGGSQSVVMNLYRNIDRSKIQFDFIVDHTEYSGYEDEIKELGGKVFVMPTFKGKNVKEVINAWNNFFNNHPEYKILHSHSRSYASIYLPIAKKYGLRTIIHSHSTSNGSGIISGIKTILQYPLRYQADYYMACSKDAGKWLFGKKIVNGDKFYILKNAIDTKKYAFNESVRKQYRDKFNIIDERIFIQIGNYIKTKNHRFSIECFKELLKINDNCRLYFVGTGEKDKIDEIESIIKENNLKEKVIMLGSRNDVEKLLQMADCYIMPSIYEGISLAAIEAQTSGIMCLLSNTVSNDVKVSENCKFIPLNKENWIESMSEDFSLRKNTCALIASEGYDINVTSNWLTNFYREIVNE